MEYSKLFEGFRYKRVQLRKRNTEITDYNTQYRSFAFKTKQGLDFNRTTSIAIATVQSASLLSSSDNYPAVPSLLSQLPLIPQHPQSAFLPKGLILTMN